MAELPPAWAATAARKKAMLHGAWNSQSGGMISPLKPDLDVMLNHIINAAGGGIDVEHWPVSQLRAAIKAAK